MSLKTYLKNNPLMDLTVAGLSGEPITFNTVDECMFNSANMEERHEVISGKIAFINGCLEMKRDLLLEKKAEIKVTEAKTWAETKNTATDVNGKVLSDKRVDMEITYSEAVENLNKEYLGIAKEVRRLEGFVTDLRGAKIAMETILKTRII